MLAKHNMCDCDCGGWHSTQPLFDVLSWSMACLEQGVSPTARHDGTAWTQRDQTHRMQGNQALPSAALLQIRGDWESRSSIFRFPTASNHQFCWKCAATKTGPMDYRDVGPDAAHRGTLVSHDSYTQACADAGHQPSNILNCPGVTVDHIAIDSMHAADLGGFWLALIHRVYAPLKPPPLRGHFPYTDPTKWGNDALQAASAYI